MAWTMSVRTRRKLVSSATRGMTTTGIDTFTKSPALALSPTLRTSNVLLQLSLLGTALAHVTTAPILAALATIAAAIFLISSWPIRQQQSVGLPPREALAARRGNTPRSEAVSIERASASPRAVSPAIPLQSSLNSPFCDIAPAANDAEAWAGLCARLSHELRTPLNAVLGFSELMKAELHGPLGRPLYQEYVSHIRESGQALLKSTEDTLAITALLTSNRIRNSAVFHGLALEPLLAGAWHFIEPSAQARSVSFKCSIPAELEILGDERALRQAMINLLQEAICHAPNVGEVSASASTECGMIRLEIGTQSCKEGRRNDTLSIHLARALLEFSGSKLAITSGEGGWHASVLLERATQPDFFQGFEKRAATA